jgi:regulator of protease activity HflC (stomatin/prohibitin superfamily)
MRGRQFSGVGIGMMLACLAAGLVAMRAMGQQWPAVAGALVGLYFLFAIKVVDQWEKVAVLRFGKYRRLRGPGVFLIVPVVVC